ncbi:MAG TPA: hypothetical protein DEH25_05350 [Chloroflexi bacterium]|nr:hypothetical protein [Chloroflexota bacterium]HBY06450.1 hypothetical protein [Chloroflexota bacterium]
MITLHNQRLVVQIQEPGSNYRRSRFDWSGICQQITLDGCHTYLSQEASESNRGTEGIGLSDEFGITTPIGYAEIGPGEWFPKIGVGFLQKTSREPYDFFSDYPIQPAQIGVEQNRNDAVTFRQVAKNEGGWGWDLEKTYSLSETRLKIGYALENLGEKTICTEAYNHNFLQFDRHTIGPDYTLQVSFSLQLAIMDGPLTAKNSLLRLTETPKPHIYAQQPDCASLQNVQWSLIHQPSGHGVRLQEQFALYKFALWGMYHVISPEFFVWIDLEPGAKQNWERVYEFF